MACGVTFFIRKFQGIEVRPAHDRLLAQLTLAAPTAVDAHDFAPHLETRIEGEREQTAAATRTALVESGLARLASKSRAQAFWNRTAAKVRRITEGAYPGCTLISERYYLEMLDVLHEYGERLHKRHESWSACVAAPLFFDWLGQGRESPFHPVIQVPERSLEKYRLVIEKGALVVPDSFNPEWLEQITQTTLGPTTLIIVVNRFGKIYGGIKQPMRFHHSSFLAGKPVTMAGTLEIDHQMMVRQVSNCSGHYKTGRAGTEQFVRRLGDCGVSLPLLIVNFRLVGETRTQTNAVTFLQNSTQNGSA